MDKLASPQDLQAELRRLIAYSQSDEPSRQKLASELHKLADRVSAQKTANTGFDILKTLIDYNDYIKLYDRLDEADGQSAKLMHEIFYALAKELDINRGAAEALNRMRDITSRGQRWDVALLRNNIFKAANSLGLRLPSHSF